ncbi:MULTISPECIES: dephospho-CoA kinase [Mediterranea]|uniref:dephospho-CoA kinase n=1 Tax=Mediterranea TaxID=1926659 RepID=UPI002010F062|nr:MULTISPECIES: dephospho-CoA kinase [Mediterranea]MCL1608878.1 dephospho-CoA kinase [Mediterranea sp. ET5]MDM8122162.1 dephospho-CoA kinase [Mediterranea massiliensis]MDM8197602.1 dephospho-CoA kinase [Mediterranea massiliensis]
MIKLGITGGIGSGKSVVSRLLQIMDIPVYQTDDEAKRLTVADPHIRRDLSALVGDAVYASDGSLNKEVLASYIFGFPERIARVNAIIHPRVKTDFEHWSERQRQCRLVGMECAILYESGFENTVDKVIAVSAPWNVRLCRAMKRDAAREEQIRKRMEHQLPDEELCARADFVVRNDGVTPLLPQLEQILAQLNAFPKSVDRS